MSFFDYPGTQAEATKEQDAEVFLPEASDSDWAALLRHCRRRRYGPGETVISAEGARRSLYIVVDGTLEVLLPVAGKGAGRSRKAITIGAGSVLGEMSFFDNAERSAVVRATTELEVAELGIAEFDALAEEDPRLGREILFDLGRILAQRLRRAQGPASGA